MCFQNLPITFDPDGRPRVEDPEGFAVPDRGPAPFVARPADPSARLKEVEIDPVTRVAGALALHATVDTENRSVVDSHARAVMFRGYELILKHRDPHDAIWISSRACGVCGGVHSTCAAMALEMTFGVTPPPLALVARNLAEAAELLYDHCLHLFLLSGPDYSEAVVSATNPTLWRRAEGAAAPRAGIHGMTTIAEIMTGLNALQGSLYLEALEVTRAGREIVSLIFGKYPHPSAIIPAGLGTSLDHSMLNQVLARIVRLLDYAKRAAAVWEDIVDFFYDADPRYAQVGVRRTNLISNGMWDDPNHYDGTYASADEWGLKRLSTPGAIVDGELRTTRLNQINLGIEEFVEHSFYEQWGADSSPIRAPDGAELSPFHPWNKKTIPRPERAAWKERYSWSTSPRWDREPMEAGPLARQWITAVAGVVQTDFIKSGGSRIEIVLPKGTLPEMVIEWRVPQVVNALERMRARATHIGYCLMVAYSFLLRAFDLHRAGETAMTAPYEVRDGIGVGYWEAGRGILTHHSDVRDGRLHNYQIVTPSTWMASPRDPWGVPGPYEEAVMNTPIVEETADESFRGIDLLRTVRSFDPCMPCTVHMFTGRHTVVRDATSCACGMEG